MSWRKWQPSNADSTRYRSKLSHTDEGGVSLSVPLARTAQAAGLPDGGATGLVWSRARGRRRQHLGSLGAGSDGTP